MRNLAVGEWEDWDMVALDGRLSILREEITAIENEITRRNQIMRQRFTRDERKRQIRALLASGQIFTTAQVAKALSLKPTNNLRNILCELYSCGEISGYADGKVASHPIYHWYVQSTLPLPFPPSSRDKPCNEPFVDVWMGS